VRAVFLLAGIIAVRTLKRKRVAVCLRRILAVIDFSYSLNLSWQSVPTSASCQHHASICADTDRLLSVVGAATDCDNRFSCYPRST